jgi:hypothetical protein
LHSQTRRSRQRDIGAWRGQELPSIHTDALCLEPKLFCISIPKEPRVCCGSGGKEKKVRDRPERCWKPSCGGVFGEGKYIHVMDVTQHAVVSGSTTGKS